jgi:hypothetical protein
MHDNETNKTSNECVHVDTTRHNVLLCKGSPGFSDRLGVYKKVGVAASPPVGQTNHNLGLVERHDLHQSRMKDNPLVRNTHVTLLG